MRVMVMVKATKESEAGVMPSEKLLTEMGKFNEELVKAGGYYADLYEKQLLEEELAAS